MVNVENSCAATRFQGNIVNKAAEGAKIENQHISGYACEVKTMCSRINVARGPEIESDKNLSFAMAVNFCDNQLGRLIITRAEGDAK